MAKDIHDLHAQVNAKPGFTSVKNANANTIQVSKGNAIAFARVMHDPLNDRVFIGDGSGMMVADTTRWLASLR
jgi:hypothetical protein